MEHRKIEYKTGVRDVILLHIFMFGKAKSTEVQGVKWTSGMKKGKNYWYLNQKSKKYEKRKHGGGGNPSRENEPRPGREDEE